MTNSIDQSWYRLPRGWSSRSLDSSKDAWRDTGRITFRLDNADRHQLQKEAEEAGYSDMSSFIRFKLFGNSEKPERSEVGEKYLKLTALRQHAAATHPIPYREDAHETKSKKR